jgi:hypothetical protein
MMVSASSSSWCPSWNECNEHVPLESPYPFHADAIVIPYLASGIMQVTNHDHILLLCCYQMTYRGLTNNDRGSGMPAHITDTCRPTLWGLPHGPVIRIRRPLRYSMSSRRPDIDDAGKGGIQVPDENFAILASGIDITRIATACGRKMASYQGAKHPMPSKCDDGVVGRVGNPPVLVVMIHSIIKGLITR